MAGVVVAVAVAVVVDQVVLVVLAAVVREQFRAVRQLQARQIQAAAVVLLERDRVLVVLAVQASSSLNTLHLFLLELRLAHPESGQRLVSLSIRRLVVGLCFPLLQLNTLLLRVVVAEVDHGMVLGMERVVAAQGDT
jgi:hypothetical protein